MSAASIYIPQRLRKSYTRSQDRRDTLEGAALGIALAAAVFGFAELIHHSGHNPFLADELTAAGEPA